MAKILNFFEGGQQIYIPACSNRDIWNKRLKVVVQ